MAHEKMKFVLAIGFFLFTPVLVGCSDDSTESEYKIEKIRRQKKREI